MQHGPHRKSWSIRTGLPLVLALAAVAFIAHGVWFKLPRRWDAGYVQGAQAQGQLLLTALAAYRTQHGEWPDTLSRLTGPIPPPDLGMRQWIYTRREGAFTLRVNGSPSGYPSLQYTSEKQQWEMDS